MEPTIFSRCCSTRGDDTGWDFKVNQRPEPTTRVPVSCVVVEIPESRVDLKSFHWSRRDFFCSERQRGTRALVVSG